MQLRAMRSGRVRSVGLEEIPLQVMMIFELLVFYAGALTLLIRAVRGGVLSRFPLFYSYIFYMLLSSAAMMTVYTAAPSYYAKAAWFRFLLSLVAEFAVLIEISDQIFKPYPAIRQLGRLLTVGVGVVFSSVYIAPALLRASPSDIAFLSIAQEMALTKAVIILVLLLAARYFRLPLGRNASGMMLGFALYLTVSIVTFTAAGYYGKALFGNILPILLPWSYDVCLLVWVVALWRYEPDLVPEQMPGEREKVHPEPLSAQLGHFNTALTRLLGK